MADTPAAANDPVWGEGITTEHVVRATTVMCQIDNLIARRKERRLNNAPIMRLTRDEYQPPFDAAPTAPLELDWIKGAARLVFEHCQRLALNPTIECIGWAADTHIVVHW